jgi:hypothetical protein
MRIVETQNFAPSHSSDLCWTLRALGNYSSYNRGKKDDDYAKTAAT